MMKASLEINAFNWYFVSILFAKFSPGWPHRYAIDHIYLYIRCTKILAEGSCMCRPAGTSVCGFVYFVKSISIAHKLHV